MTIVFGCCCNEVLFLCGVIRKFCNTFFVSCAVFCFIWNNCNLCLQSTECPTSELLSSRTVSHRRLVADIVHYASPCTILATFSSISDSPTARKLLHMFRLLVKLMSASSMAKLVIVLNMTWCDQRYIATQTFRSSYYEDMFSSLLKLSIRFYPRTLLSLVLNRTDYLFQPPWTFNIVIKLRRLSLRKLMHFDAIKPLINLSLAGRSSP